MTETGFAQIDTAEVDKMLDRLGNDATTAIWEGVKAGANALKYGAQERFRRSRKGASNPQDTLGGKPLYEGVQSKYYPDYMEAIVHILGDFKLKWFEAGTDDRYNGKRNVGGGKRRKIYKRRSVKGNGTRYTGRITAKPFFLGDEGEITDTMMRSVERYIMNITGE